MLGSSFVMSYTQFDRHGLELSGSMESGLVVVADQRNLRHRRFNQRKRGIPHERDPGEHFGSPVHTAANLAAMNFTDRPGGRIDGLD